MNINFTFYTVEERKPKRDEEIMWLQKVSSWGIHTFNFVPVDVEYSYEEVDEDGNLTGTGYCEPAENTVECIVFDGVVAEPDFLWCPIEEFYNVLEGIEEKHNEN